MDEAGIMAGIETNIEFWDHPTVAPHCMQLQYMVQTTSEERKLRNERYRVTKKDVTTSPQLLP